MDWTLPTHLHSHRPFPTLAEVGDSGNTHSIRESHSQTCEKESRSQTQKGSRKGRTKEILEWSWQTAGCNNNLEILEDTHNLLLSRCLQAPNT